MQIDFDRPGYIGLTVTEWRDQWRASVELPDGEWVDGPVMDSASAAIRAAFFAAFPPAIPA